MDTDHYVPVFPEALCRRVSSAIRDVPGFRKDIPFLRLLIGSKAGEVIEFIVVSHDAPPKARMNSGIVPDFLR